jgi:hypothetical protein
VHRTPVTGTRDIGDTLVSRGVRLSPGGSIYDPADPMSKMFFNMLAVFAEFEADLLRMRTREGIAIARSRGKLKGRQPELTARQQAELVRMHATGGYTIAELMEVFSVGRATVCRVLGRAAASTGRLVTSACYGLVFGRQTALLESLPRDLDPKPAQFATRAMRHSWQGFNQGQGIHTPSRWVIGRG